MHVRKPESAVIYVGERESKDGRAKVHKADSKGRDAGTIA